MPMRFSPSMPLALLACVALSAAASLHAKPKQQGSPPPGAAAGKREAPTASPSEPMKMVIQNGHASGVNGVAFSPDGQRLVTVAHDIKVWRAADGILLDTITPPGGEIPTAVAIHPDGKMVAMGMGGTAPGVTLWGLDGRPIRTFAGRVEGLVFSPDGQTLGGFRVDTVKLWDLEGKELLSVSMDPKIYVNVGGMAFSPDGQSFITGSADKLVKRWSLNGKLLQTFTGHTGKVASVAFSPDGNSIASGGEDSTVRLWNVDGRLRQTLTIPGAGGARNVGSIELVAFSPDGQTVAAIPSFMSSADVVFWSLDGTFLPTISGHRMPTKSLAYSRDGRWLATGGQDSRVILRRVDGTEKRTLDGEQRVVRGVAYTPDGRTLVTISYDGTARALGADARLLWSWRCPKCFNDSLWALATSPDGRHVAIAPTSGDVRIFSRDGTLLRGFPSNDISITNWPTCVAFSPDGKHVVSGYVDHSVKLWTLEGRLLGTFKGHTNGVYGVAFGADGETVLSVSHDQTLRTWKKDGTLLRTETKAAAINAMKMSPDGKTVALALHNGPVELWSIEGTRLASFAAVGGFAFSPDSQRVASAGDNFTVSIRGLDGTVLKTLDGAEGGVASLAFSPDGKQLASGGGDGSVRFWNLDTGASIAFLGVGSEYIIYAADGIWDGSKSCGGLVAMVRGQDAWGIDQFAVRNNRPDLLLERIGMGTPELLAHYRSQYLKRLRKAGFSEADLTAELHVPEAAITELKQEGKTAQLGIALKDGRFPLKSYNIHVNDVPLFGAYGKDLRGVKSKSFAESVELGAGRNKIEVSCTNARGAESYRAMVQAEYKAEVKGDLYFVGFGVSKYQDRDLTLEYADKDARDLAEVFSRMQGKYGKVYVKTYLNEEVTPDNIRSAKSLLKDAKVDDTFVLFIAGHGLHDHDKEATYYYLTHAAKLDDLKGTCADFDLVEDLLQGIAPRNKLFLMDTCESGEVDGAVQSRYEAVAAARGSKARSVRGVRIKQDASAQPAVREYLFAKDRYIYNDLSRRSGAIVFSAARGGEVSIEDPKIENGYFTQAILDALQGLGPKPVSGVVGVDDLRKFVADKVAEDSGGAQHPTVDRDNLFQKFGFPTPAPAK